MSHFTVGLGITAGISAYKILYFASLLRKNDYKIIPILTKDSLNFITPLSLQSICDNRVYFNQFELVENYNPEHIAIARECDLIVVAPATADFISKMASGAADELLLSVILSFKKKVIVVPAMNPAMYNHKATRRNLEQIERYGYKVIGPVEGWSACGDFGKGRMVEPEDIFYYIEEERGRIQGRLKNKKVLLTSGPTIEFIDSMRYISNLSSGFMGKFIAEELIREGALVEIISGPVKISYPSVCLVTKISSAIEMFNQVKKRIANNDCFVAAAAVSDYRPEIKEKIKLPKKDSIDIKLIKNPDILEWVSKNYFKKKFIVGFSATSNLKESPHQKLKNKPVDLLVVNPVGVKGKGPGEEINDAIIYDTNANILKELDSLPKKEIARHLVEMIINKSMSP
ncbi:MAG: bifunctional phosphopantothenoylcysteine decarboxylase/phosphopantothenate--cysteine ligase CoaBC [Candidatus Hydrogenedentota bacterium]